MNDIWKRRMGGSAKKGAALDGSDRKQCDQPLIGGLAK